MTKKELVKMIIDDPESEIQYIDVDTYKHAIEIRILSEDKECYKFNNLLDSLED